MVSGALMRKRLDFTYQKLGVNPPWKEIWQFTQGKVLKEIGHDELIKDMHIFSVLPGKIASGIKIEVEHAYINIYIYIYIYIYSIYIVILNSQEPGIQPQPLATKAYKSHGPVIRGWG